MADSGWGITTLCNVLWGLAPGVKDELATRELPPELDDLITLATCIDCHIQERRSERTTPHS